MQKNVAVALALVVVLGTFFGKDLLPKVGFPASFASAIPASRFSLPQISFDTFTKTGDAQVAIEAWETFAAYRAAAERHNLEEVKRLSYQLSPTCKAALTDNSKLPDCYQLMDSVVFFTSSMKKEYFTNVDYDARQIILSTDYRTVAGGEAPVKMVIYFVREGETSKILSLNFCTGKDTEHDVCFEARPDKRDKNNNGWWDDIEALFAR